MQVRPSYSLGIHAVMLSRFPNGFGAGFREFDLGPFADVISSPAFRRTSPHPRAMAHKMLPLSKSGDELQMRLARVPLVAEAHSPNYAAGFEIGLLFDFFPEVTVPTHRGRLYLSHYFLNIGELQNLAEGWKLTLPVNHGVIFSPMVAIDLSMGNEKVSPGEDNQFWLMTPDQKRISTWPRLGRTVIGGSRDIFNYEKLSREEGVALCRQILNGMAECFAPKVIDVKNQIFKNFLLALCIINWTLEKRAERRRGEPVVISGGF
jgi:hypothetical protein